MVLTSISYGSASPEFRRAFLFLLVFSLFLFFAGRFGVAEGGGQVLWHPNLQPPFVGRVRAKTLAFAGVFGFADDPFYFLFFWFHYINLTICFNEDVKKILLKLSKDISIHATLKKEDSCFKFWVNYNLE